MAKTKHQQTASHRREEVKAQRQQRQTLGPGKQAQSGNKRRARNTRKSLPWGLVVGVLLVLATVIGVFIYVSHQSSSSSSSSTSTPVPASVLGTVTNVSPSTLVAVGTGGLRNFLVPVVNKSGSVQPPLVGPTGKPEIFYYGAEYCPYCAAQRWGVIVALSRFGSFTNLHLTTSSAGDAYASTPTFTFYNSSYTSKYIDFVPVESEGQTQGQTLQTPTAEQQQLFNTYDGPPYFSSNTQGSIPFIDIGNRFLTQGASYDVGVLRTNPKDSSSAPLTQQDVANALANQNSDITKGIVGTANYLTAAICQATNQQPASVCSAAPILQIEPLLGKTAFNALSLPAGLVDGPFDMPAGRQD